MIDYSDILEVNVDDAKARILSWMERLRIPVTMWEEGGVGLAVVEIGANIWAEVSKIAVSLKEFSVGSTATGSGLTIYSRNMFGHERSLGEYAVHKVQLTCGATSGPYTLNSGDVVVTDGTSTFEVIEVVGGSFPYVLSSGTSEYFKAKCNKVGTAANVAIGEIDQLVTTYVGVTAANVDVGDGSSLYVAGAEIESDASLQLRNQQKWPTLNALSFVADAWEYYARQVSASVTRVAVVDTPGNVLVVLASATGGVGSTVVTAVETDLQARVLPSLVTVTAQDASELAVPLTGTIYYNSAFTEASVKTAVTNVTTGSINTRLGTVPIGGESLSGMGTHVMPVSYLTEAIQATEIGGTRCIQAVNITSPSGYVTLAADEIPRQGSVAGLTWVGVAV